MELVLFKYLLEDDAEPQYGLLEDRDEPSVICLCCGSAVEFGDYEIIERLAWQDLSSAVKQSRKNRYVVCMNESYVRDAQRVNSDELSQEEFAVKAGIRKEHLPIYRRMERKFGKYVCGEKGEEKYINHYEKSVFTQTIQFK